MSQATIDSWVERSSTMVVKYFGSFGVPKLRVAIITGGFGDLGWGQHFGGKRIEVHAGRRTTPNDIERDWVMVHEMLHTAFPSLAKKHGWMREGLSTYLESVVRVEAGVIEADEMWERWQRMMENGLPRGADRGYDHSRSWGTKYWGGALYWFLADVQIRAETNNKHSLQTALRAIHDAGGDARYVWKPLRALKIGDKATGTNVLKDLYVGMGRARGDVDLDALFAKLGVRESGYDDAAPWAHVRKAMSKQRYSLPPLVRK